MSVPLAKVILLTKDANDVIQSFLDFYGYLFGFENIVVIDNGSTDTTVLEVYKKYKPKGVTVIVDKTPFHQAYSFMTKYMLQYKDKCEFLVPMETDEFIFHIPHQNDNNYILTPEVVHEYMRSLPKDVSVVRYGRMYATSVCTYDRVYRENGHMYPDPPTQMTKFFDQNWDKIFVRASAFVKVDQWLHHVEVNNGRKIVSDKLGLLHFHQTGAKRDWERSCALVSINGYGYIQEDLPIDTRMAIAKYLKTIHAPGYHRLEMYYNVCRRQRIAEEFMRFVHRLPTISELNVLLQKSPYFEVIQEHMIQNIEYYRQNNIQGLATTIEDVLFDEPNMTYQFIVYQVANTISQIRDENKENRNHSSS